MWYSTCAHYCTSKHERGWGGCSNLGGTASSAQCAYIVRNAGHDRTSSRPAAAASEVDASWCNQAPNPLHSIAHARIHHAAVYRLPFI